MRVEGAMHIESCMLSPLRIYYNDFVYVHSNQFIEMERGANSKRTKQKMYIYIVYVVRCTCNAVSMELQQMQRYHDYHLAQKSVEDGKVED